MVYSLSLMELRHLRYFVAVAETLHFGRAAAALRIAQPSLSQQIQQLEGELQTPLFERTQRHVELTVAGRLFLVEARKVLAHADRAALVARRAAHGEPARVRIGVGHCMDTVRIARAVGGLACFQPGPRVDLLTIAAPQQVPALREGGLDIGLLRPPVDDPSLATEVLASDPMRVALPAKHRLATKRRLALGALAEELFVLADRVAAPVDHDLVLRSCREAGFVPTAPHEADQLQLLLGMVAADCGVALVPNSARRFLPRGVVLRPLELPSPMFQTAIAWRREDSSTIVAAFVAAARRAFSRSAPASSTGTSARRSRRSTG